MNRVFCPSLLSGAGQEQNQVWYHRSRKEASGLDRESQIELRVKSGLITENLNERHQKLEKVKHHNNSQETRIKGQMKEVSNQNTSKTETNKQKDVENKNNNEEDEEEQEPNKHQTEADASSS